MATRKEVLDSAANLLRLYSATHPDNPVRGKSIRDWTPEDFKKLDLSDIAILLRTIEFDDAEITRSLLPRDMSIAQFHVALLREAESRQRGSVEFDLRPLEVKLKNNERTVPLVIPAVAYNGGEYSFPNDQASSQLKPSEAVAWVAAMQLLAETDRMPDATRAELRARADALGNELTRRGVQLSRTPLTDAGAFGLGRVIGHIATLNPRLNPTGPSISVSLPQSPDQVQQTYCGAVDLIHETGLQVNQADAFRTGLFQGRVDAARGVTSGAELGLFAPCPTRVAAAR